MKSRWDHLTSCVLQGHDENGELTSAQRSTLAWKLPLELSMMEDLCPDKLGVVRSNIRDPGIWLWERTMSCYH